MAYHQVGNTYVSTEEAVQHGSTVFALGVAACFGGAAALVLYYFFHAMPYFLAHEEQAKAAYWSVAWLFFIVGLKYVREILLSFVGLLIAWSVITQVFKLPMLPWPTSGSQPRPLKCQVGYVTPSGHKVRELCSANDVPAIDVTIDSRR